MTTKSNFWLVQLSQWSLFVLSAGAYALLPLRARSRRMLRILTGLLLGLGLLRISAWIPLIGFLPGKFLLQGPLTYVWITGLSLGLALFDSGLRLRLRVPLAILGLATWVLPLYLARGWASGWLPSLIAAAVLLILRFGLTASVSGLGPFIALTLAVGAGTAGLIRMMRLEVWSLDTRFIAFRGLVDLLEGRWLMGLGLASYWHYWRGIFGQISYLEPATGELHYSFSPTVNTHNNYLDILGQAGLLGLAAFVWLLLALLRQAWRQFRAEPPGFGRAFGGASLAGLVGMAAAGMMGDWMIPFVYNVGLNGFRDSFVAWVLLGGLTLLEHSRASGQPEADLEDLTAS